MDALTAFEHREDALREQLTRAQSMQQAIAACSMALEQMACEMAQDEQDEHARQRQQAILAVVRQAPLLLQGAHATGELVVRNEPKARSTWSKIMRGLQMGGVALLAVLAIVDYVQGRATMAMAQAAGVVLLAVGSIRTSAVDERMQARAVVDVDVPALLMQMRKLCQAVDVCVGDLALLDVPASTARLSGTADEATLDLLVSLLEAKASGRQDAAMRSLSLAQEYLHMLGVEVVEYAPEQAALFDALPTVGASRTVRPALLKDGKVLRRGVAAVSMKGGVSA